jgi:hypothetical protein
MNEENIQAFRQGFCEKAAELGISPSELLAFKDASTKQSTGIMDFIKGIPGFLEKNIPLTIGAGLASGATAGALGAYLYNKGQFQLDPEGSLGANFDEIDEAKNLHLMAKYRNAVRQIKNED